MKKLLPVLFVVLTSFAYGQTYYVGGAGASDSNTGTTPSAPFATIQKAADVAGNGSVVNIRAGTYRETVVPANSGVTFQPDQGAAVIISGLEIIPNTGWSALPTNANIYKKTITLPVNGFNTSTTQNIYPGATIYANQLFRNGEMQFEARWPKINTFADLLDRSKFRQLSSMVTWKPGYLQDNGLPQIGLVGATLVSNGWYITETRTISSHIGNQISYSPNIREDDEKGKWTRQRYYLTGKRELLTDPKEWHYENNTLYFYQQGGGSPSGTIEYKARNWGFDVRGKSSIIIKGLTFVGCDPVVGNVNSANTVIDGIRASYMNHHVRHDVQEWQGVGMSKMFGIKLLGANSIIKNSELHSSGSSGVWLGPDCRAENNLMHDMGYVGLWANPISLWDKDGGQIIKYNTIYRVGRSCIDFGYNFGTTTAPSQHFNVEIAYNDMYEYGMISSDVGATYAWGQCDLTGLKYHHNWIHDCLAKSIPDQEGIQVGIYFDQASGPGTIHHNVTWNCVDSDMYHEVSNDHRGQGQAGWSQPNPSMGIYNNTFATSTNEHPSHQASYRTHVNTPLEHQRNNIYHRQIIIKWAESAGHIANSVANSVMPGTNAQYVGGNLNVLKGLYFQIGENSPARTGGIPISGVTAGIYKGAYEYGGDAWVAGNNGPVGPGGGTPPTGTTKYEAEAAARTGNASVNTNHTGYSGTGFVDSFYGIGTSVTFSVNAASAGSRVVTLRYANGNSASSLSLYLNNVKVQQIALPTTGNWDTWGDKTNSLTLNAGVNTIMYKMDAGDVAVVNLDYITVSGDAIAPSAPTNLALQSKTDTSISLTWTASTDNVGVTGYEIYNGSTLLASIAPATSHNITGLLPNTAYVLTVKAKDAENNVSASSNTVNVTTDAAPTGTTKYEAEAATRAGSASVNTNHTGYSGTGFVDSFYSTGASVTFSVNAASAGSRVVTLRYANGNSASSLSLYLNNVKVQQVALSTTGNWDTWGDKTNSLTLNAGVNTIMYKKDADDVAVVNLDYITVSGDAIAPSAPTNLTSLSKTDTSVTLTWTASTDNVGVTGYDIYRGGTTFCGSSTTLSFPVTGLTANTAYSFTVRAKDAAGNISTASTALNITTAALPPPWLTQDIGSVGVVGSASYSGGTFTVDGSGTDIWSTTDEFRFVYQSISGDGEIIARVASIENVDLQSKAGVMIRETLTGGSKHVLVNLSPMPQQQFLRRSATNGVTVATVATSPAAPHWVKLKRTGNAFDAFTSSNGTTWTQLGTTQTVTMSANVHVGLAVLAKNNTSLNTSTFDNVILNDGNGNPLGRMAFGEPVNDAVVILVNDAVVINDEPSENNSRLFQNHPNSFSVETEIKLYLLESAKTASVIIYDLSGKVMKNIEINNRGTTSVFVGGSELKSGMYLYSLFVDGNVIDIKRMILTK